MVKEALNERGDLTKAQRIADPRLIHAHIVALVDRQGDDPDLGLILGRVPGAKNDPHRGGDYINYRVTSVPNPTVQKINSFINNLGWEPESAKTRHMIGVFLEPTITARQEELGVMIEQAENGERKFLPPDDKDYKEEFIKGKEDELLRIKKMLEDLRSNLDTLEQGLVKKYGRNYPRVVRFMVELGLDVDRSNTERHDVKKKVGEFLREGKVNEALDYLQKLHDKENKKTL